MSVKFLAGNGNPESQLMMGLVLEKGGNDHGMVFSITPNPDS
jgi:hypothetical protein